MVFTGHTSTVRACAVDASNMRLVSGGKDATIRCHDTHTGAMLWFSDGHADYINCMLIRGALRNHMLALRHIAWRGVMGCRPGGVHVGTGWDNKGVAP